VDPDKSWIRPLGEGARIYVEVEGRPLRRYAATLQIRVNGGWQTIFLFDNSHGDHTCTGTLAARSSLLNRFMEGDPREVLPAAIAFLVDHWQAVVGSWTN